MIRRTVTVVLKTSPRSSASPRRCSPKFAETSLSEHKNSIFTKIHLTRVKTFTPTTDFRTCRGLFRGTFCNFVARNDENHSKMKQQIHNRRFLLLLTIMLAATFGMAQTVIVKDSITNEPIPFVSVYFGKESGGYTDEKGAIAIPNEAAQMRLSHICYVWERNPWMGE